jgi:hypothetical protein
MLKEYADLCRARVCIKGDDAANYNPAVRRLNFLSEELDLMHQSLKNADRFSGGAGMDISFETETPMATLALLKKGVALMRDMAELRMPRNHNASRDPRPELGDEATPETRQAFRKADTSSAGRLGNDVAAHLVQLNALDRDDVRHNDRMSAHANGKPDPGPPNYDEWPKVGGSGR